MRRLSRSRLRVLPEINDPSILRDIFEQNSDLLHALFLERLEAAETDILTGERRTLRQIAQLTGVGIRQLKQYYASQQPKPRRKRKGNPNVND
jgi:hypothetical protein